MTKDQISDRDLFEFEDDCIDDVDRALNPLGRFYGHNAMHVGTTWMVLDEFGRASATSKAAGRATSSRNQFCR